MSFILSLPRCPLKNTFFLIHLLPLSFFFSFPRFPSFLPTNHMFFIENPLTRSQPTPPAAGAS